MNDVFLFFTIIILTLAGALAIEFGARELLRITNKKRNQSLVIGDFYSWPNGTRSTHKLFTTTTMKLTTFEQAKEHYRMGYYSLVKDDVGNCAVLTTKDNNGSRFYRTTWGSEDATTSSRDLGVATSEQGYIDSLTMVRPIHPSHFMGSGIKVGDKVRIKYPIFENYDKIYEITDIATEAESKLTSGNVKYQLDNGGREFSQAALIPAPFEKQDSKAVLDAIELLKREGKLVDGKILNA